MATEHQRAYTRTRLMCLIQQGLLRSLGPLQRRQVAARAGCKPPQVTRWLSYPSNLTLGTVSDLFLAMGYEVESITLRNTVTDERIQIQR